jgi:hypothetical protein
MQPWGTTWLIAVGESVLTLVIGLLIFERNRAAACRRGTLGQY